MLLWVLFVGLAIFTYFYILKSSPIVLQKPDNIMKMKLNLQPYSGINKDLFIQYMNNLDLFKTSLDNNNIEIASKYFYKSIDNAYEMQLYDQDFDFTSIIRGNAILGEEMLLRTSHEHKTFFNPKYLNNIVI